MTQPQDPYTNLVQESQEAFQHAAETWTKTVQDTMSGAGMPTAAPVDPQQVVDQVFDFAERMLAMQKEFTHQLIQNSVTLQQTLAQQGQQQGQQQAGQAGSTGAEA